MTSDLIDPLSAGSVPDGKRRSQVLHLEGFEPAQPMDACESEAFSRRMVTLLHDGDAVRKGGNGRILRVRNVWGETFALKVLSAADGQEFSEAAVDRFQHEYRVHRCVSGLKGFPRVYGMARLQGAPCILMEWVEGVTLSKAARMLAVDDECRISPLNAARIGRDIFETLARLADVEGEVVHGDISSGNVMVRTDRLSLAEQAEEGVFDACIVDFGSSVVASPETGTAELRSPTGRVGSSPFATHDFAAPEVMSGSGRIDASADVYAAASLIFLLAGGRAPFGSVERLPLEELVRRKREGAPLPLRTAHSATDVSAVLSFEPEVAVGVSLIANAVGETASAEEVRAALLRVDSQLDELLLTCLAALPDERPNAARMRDALGAFAFHYVENVARALSGSALLPCAPGSLADGFGETQRERASALRRVGRIICATAVSAVVVLTGFALGSAPIPFRAFDGACQGFFAGVVGGVATALPAVCTVVASRFKAKPARRLVVSGIGAVVGVLFGVAAVTAFVPGGSDLAVMLGSAFAVSALGGWWAVLLGTLFPSVKLRSGKHAALHVPASFAPGISHTPLPGNGSLKTVEERKVR